MIILPPLKRLLSATLVIFVVARIGVRFGLQAALIALLAGGVLLSLIWFGEWWASYLLPFGWWGRPKPSDLDNPAYAVILPLLGWVLLLALVVLACQT